MTDNELRQVIVNKLREAQAALFEIEALCNREGVNFVGGVPSDVRSLASGFQPEAVELVRFPC